MGLRYKDRVQETSTTTGTGSLTLAGAVTGYQSFNSALSNGDTCYYAISDTTNNAWEVGLGTFTASATLARTTVLASSNSGSAVSLGAGTKQVFLTVPAAKIGPAFNVKAYGAKGDGSTNDSTAIQAAIAAAGVAGGTVFFPAATYIINVALSITSSNITLEGEGSATVLQAANSLNDNVISITGATMNIKLRRFVIDGNKANQTSGNGLYIKNTSGSGDSDNVFEDLLIQNCKNDALKIDTGNANGSMYFLRVHCRTSNGNGFNDLAITDSVFDQCIAETNALNGFYVGGVDNHYSNCKTFYNGSTAGSNHGYNIAGYNNYFDTCEAQDNYQSGFYTQNAGDATYGAQNCVLVNCAADSNNQAQGVLYGNGFQLKNVSGWMLIGCQALVRPYASAWGQKFGISLEGTTQQTQITNLQGSGNIGAPAPGVASAATAAGTTLGVGLYRYKVTFVTAAGETQGGTEFTITTTTSNTNVSLTAIPTGGSGVTARKIYRTQLAGATGTEKLVATLNDNTTTTYTDSSSDASITGNAAVPTSNTTALLYLNTASGGGNVLYGLNPAGTRIATDAGNNDMEWDNMPELFWNHTNPDISLYSASDNRLDILNAGGGKGNLNAQNQLTFGYGDYLGVSPGSSWPSGTHKLIEVAFTSTDQVNFYTPGSTTNAIIMSLLATGQINLFGPLNPVAGTASVAPIKLTSGTNLTSAAAGAEEFDGKNLYFTNDTSHGRAMVPTEQKFRLTSTGSTISSIANYFGSTSNITLISGGEYEIEIDCWFLKTTAGTVTWTFTNSAAPTAMNIDYQMSPAAGIVTTPAATDLFGQQYNLTTTAPTVVSPSLTTAVNHRHKFKIRLINGSGTSLKIQATTSAGTITPGINSSWRARRVPAANIGTFAA